MTGSKDVLRPWMHAGTFGDSQATGTQLVWKEKLPAFPARAGKAPTPRSGPCWGSSADATG